MFWRMEEWTLRTELTISAQPPFEAMLFSILISRSTILLYTPYSVVPFGVIFPSKFTVSGLVDLNTIPDP